jgi:hypothetical protein
VLVIESSVQLMAMPGILKMTLPAFLRSAPLAFVFFFFGTVLPTMVLIYAIIRPRYLKVTRSPTYLLPPLLARFLDSGRSDLAQVSDRHRDKILLDTSDDL